MSLFLPSNFRSKTSMEIALSTNNFAKNKSFWQFVNLKLLQVSAQ